MENDFLKLNWKQGEHSIRTTIAKIRKAQLDKRFLDYWREQGFGTARSDSSPMNLAWWFFRGQKPSAILAREHLLSRTASLVISEDEWRQLRDGGSHYGAGLGPPSIPNGHVNRQQERVRRQTVEYEKKELVYTLSGLASSDQYPQYFEIPKSTDRLEKAPSFDANGGHPAYSIHQRLMSATGASRFPIPSDFDHELTELKVWNAEGTQLARGKDYEILYDPAFRVYAIDGPRQLSFDATFSPRREAWQPDPKLVEALGNLSAEEIGALAGKLGRHGFKQKAARLAKLSTQKRAITLEDLDAALATKSRYTWPEDDVHYNASNSPSSNVLGPEEEWLAWAARYLDQHGQFCVQCLQQNVFADESHRFVLRENDRIKHDVRSVLVRPKGEGYLASTYSHARKYFRWSASNGRPLVSDTTPPGELIPTSGADKGGRRTNDSPDEFSAGTANLKTLRDQLIRYMESSPELRKIQLRENEPLSLFFRWSKALLGGLDAEPIPESDMSNPTKMHDLFRRLSESSTTPPPSAQRDKEKFGHYRDPQLQTILSDGFKAVADCRKALSSLAHAVPAR